MALFYGSLSFMAITEAQISRDIAALEEKTLALAGELYPLYGQYLEALGQIAQQQLISASFHLCTQVRPDRFLKLSLSQRQQMQRNLRRLGQNLTQSLELEQLQQQFTQGESGEDAEDDRPEAEDSSPGSSRAAGSRPGSSDRDPGDDPSDPQSPGSSDRSQPPQDSDSPSSEDNSPASALLAPSFSLGLDPEIEQLVTDLARSQGIDLQRFAFAALGESMEPRTQPPQSEEDPETPDQDWEEDSEPKSQDPGNPRGDRNRRAQASRSGEEDPNGEDKDPSPGESPYPSIPPELSILLASQAANLLRQGPVFPPHLNPQTTNNPQVLLEWLEALEQAVGTLLRTTSHQATKALEKVGILQNPVPDVVLEMATQGEPNPGSGPGSLLNFTIEIGKNDEGRKSMRRIQVLAIYLRLTELEFASPTLTGWRNRIRHLEQELRRLGQQYQKKQKALATAQAESAWRSSWCND